MDEAERADLVVIGGGPSGYVGAIRAAQLGMKVVCVEREALGGVCLNWGCIPTKSLLAAAELYRRLRDQAADWGILADNIRADWSRVIGRSRAVVGPLGRGVAALFRRHGVVHLSGHATIEGPGHVTVRTDQGGTGRAIETDGILIATGARPRALAGLPFDGDKVIHCRDAMSLAEQPRRLLIVGAGAIGMEFASFYRAFGSEVVLIELLDRLLPEEDEDVSAAMAKAWRKQGIETHLSSRTIGGDTSGDGVVLQIAAVEDPARVQRIEGDKVLVAVGVRGRFEDLCGPDLTLETEDDRIVVDRSTYQTNIAGIHAVGDVIGPPWLAHVASAEALACVERLGGVEPAPIDYGAIPGCVYCHPQVASLGLTEQACREQGLSFDVGRFPFQASGKAHAGGDTQGFVKIIVDRAYGEILGVHMVGEAVTELLAEVGLARRLEATVDDLMLSMHAHPTLGEALHEAALAARGRAIHS